MQDGSLKGNSLMNYMEQQRLLMQAYKVHKGRDDHPPAPAPPQQPSYPQQNSGPMRQPHVLNAHPYMNTYEVKAADRPVSYRSMPSYRAIAVEQPQQPAVQYQQPSYQTRPVQPPPPPPAYRPSSTSQYIPQPPPPPQYQVSQSHQPVYAPQHFLTQYPAPYPSHPSSHPNAAPMYPAAQYPAPQYPAPHHAPPQHMRSTQPPPPPPPPSRPPPPPSTPYPFEESESVPRRSAHFCESCEKPFWSEEDLELHVTEKHISCPVPGCQFHARPEVLVAHKLTGHVKGITDQDEQALWIQNRKANFPQRVAKGSQVSYHTMLNGFNQPALQPVQPSLQPSSQPTTSTQPSSTQPSTKPEMSKLERAIRAGMREAQLIRRQMRERLNGKSAVCTHWEEFGRCKHGNDCRFAHPKQGICEFFAQHGHCKHGNECRFEHVSKRELDRRRQLKSLPSGGMDSLNKPLGDLGYGALTSGALMKRLLLGDISSFNHQILQSLRFIVDNHFFINGRANIDINRDFPNTNHPDIDHDQDDESDNDGVRSEDDMDLFSSDSD